MDTRRGFHVIFETDMTKHDVLSNISGAIIAYDRRGVAQCIAEAGDVMQTMMLAKFNNSLPTTIRRFYREYRIDVRYGTAGISSYNVELHGDLF